MRSPNLLRRGHPPHDAEDDYTMSLNAADRKFLRGLDGSTFFILLMTMWLIHALLMSSIEQNADMLDDLCRAHYPECIVETTP